MSLLLASMDDLAGVAGIVGAIVSIVGLAFVVVQLRGAGASARAQATIQFQQAFRESSDARDRLLKTFPVHPRCVGQIAGREGGDDAFSAWERPRDLRESESADAEVVIKALNDVAQYVADGLSLRSAMQQYHTVFIRTGFLLVPFIDARNQSGQARWGVRVVELYNAALRYHRSHPKHRTKALALKREDPDGVLILIDRHGGGLQPHHGYQLGRSALQRVIDRLSVWRAVRSAERRLRQ